MVAAAIEAAFETLLFGDPAWIFGLILFMILTVVLMKLFKYAGALVIPLIIALEVMYYERNDQYGVYVWPMIILLALAILVAAYTLLSAKNN